MGEKMKPVIFRVYPGDFGSRIKMLDGTMLINGEVDLTCNRAVKMEFVRLLANSWDDDNPAAISLIKDGDIYWILDGQHRCAAVNLLKRPVDFHAFIIDLKNVHKPLTPMMKRVNTTRTFNLIDTLSRDKKRSPWPAEAESRGLAPVFITSKVKLAWTNMMRATWLAKQATRRFEKGQPDPCGIGGTPNQDDLISTWLDTPRAEVAAVLDAITWWEANVAIPAKKQRRISTPRTVNGMFCAILLYQENMRDNKAALEDAPRRLLDSAELLNTNSAAQGSSRQSSKGLLMAYLNGINYLRRVHLVRVFGME